MEQIVVPGKLTPKLILLRTKEVIAGYLRRQVRERREHMLVCHQLPTTTLTWIGKRYLLMWYLLLSLSSFHVYAAFAFNDQ